MIDTRKPLKIGSLIKTTKNVYEISSIVGRGANCLVYDATYRDFMNLEHSVRIKELFPVYLMLQRSEDDNTIVGDNTALERFDVTKQQFNLAYSNNVVFRNTKGIANSTSDAQQMLNCNNTSYIVYGYDEGADYREYKDRSLHEMLKHIKALANVIQKYHEKRYLHLDIKPENIFVIPETSEHILLFDFDSVASIDDLHNEKVDFLSYSDGFSAPEQIRGDWRKVDVWSDIYSIGAVLYYKLFGTNPSVTGMQLGSSVSLEDALFSDELLSPKLAKMIQMFLKKTLALSVYARWNNVRSVIDALDEMISLAEPNAFLLKDNFTYKENVFIGRENELLEIEQILDKKQAVFLSGVGGIGKTEIAKRYAFNNRDKYDTIVFVRFDGTVKETVLCDGFDICNFEFESRDDQCFQNKIKVLKEILSPNDLIIIDNIDVEYDENLEQLLECNCKFIFTTRSDFRDYQYDQINVYPFDNKGDAFDLFFSFNDCDYDEEQKEYIESLFRLVEYHTMMIALLSKYLRDSDDLPNELYQKFLDIEGVTNTSEVGVKHRKDKKISYQEINKHLSCLFQFSDFSDVELEIVRSLSLLGSVRIQLDVWLDMINYCFSSDQVKRLIRKGWIEETDDKKISLHQIILDLVYNEQNPTTQNCSDSIKGYVSFVLKKEKEYVKRFTQRKIADILIERIQGQDLLLAQLYYSYCLNIKYKPHLMDVAKELCQKEDTEDAIFLLIQLDILRIKKGQKKEMWMMGPEEIEGCSKQIYDEIFKIELQIFQNLRKVSCNQISSENEGVTNGVDVQCLLFWQFIDRNEIKFLSKQYYLLMDLADAILNYSEQLAEQCIESGFVEYFSALYYDVEYILLYLYFHVVKQKFDCEYQFKEKILKRLVEYYDGNYLKPTIIIDEEKSAKYTEQLNELRHRKENDDVLYIDGVSYMDAANQMMFEGNYCRALALYEKSLQNQESVFDDITYKIAEALLQIGKYDEAEKKLYEILEYDKNMELDLCFTYLQLINLYRITKDNLKLISICEEVIRIKENDPSEDAGGWIVQALIEIINLDANGTPEFEAHIEQFMKCLYLLVENNSIDSKMCGSIVSFWNGYSNDVNLVELANLLYQFATKYRVQYEEDESKEIYWCLIDNEQVRECIPNVYIKSLLWSADMFIHGCKGDYDLALQLILRAEKIFSTKQIDNQYFENKIIKLKRDLWNYGYGIEKTDLMSCDYYLIAKNELMEHRFSDNQKLEIWYDAIESCICDQNYEKTQACLLEYKICLDRNLTTYSLKNYIEKTIRFAELLEICAEENVKSDLWQYILECIKSSKISKKEQDEICLCYAQEMVRYYWSDVGYCVFVQYLYSVITNRKYSNIEHEDIDISSLLIKDLSSELIDLVVHATEYYLDLIKNYEIKTDYRDLLVSIRKYYQEDDVEFRNK